MKQREIIDKLVNEVLSRMRPRALILLTAADGYKEIIQTRLQLCKTLSPVFFIANNACEFHKKEEWCSAGTITTQSEMTWHGALDNINKVFIPFLDFTTAAEVANGLLLSDSAQLINMALMNGKPVMALDYNCNPASELNQLKGLSRGGGMDASVNYLPKLAEHGIQICTLDQMLSADPVAAAAVGGTVQPYITLGELKRRNGQAPPGAKLTDLALEYSRQKK